jgi:hypothetical protein
MNRIILSEDTFMRPLARKDELVIQEVAGEILIYDLRSDKAICLNQTSALVWQHCDGEQNISDIASKIKNELNASVSDELVWFAVNQLEKENLLANQEKIPNKFNDLSRREVIKKIGLTSMVALPVISSLVAPMAVHAQSCLPTDSPCTASAQCCSNCCKNVGGGVNQCKPGGGACLP